MMCVVLMCPEKIRLKSHAATTPCDVVKTRLQNPKVGGTVYKGALDCIGQMMVKEGPGSFFTGVVPRVGRVAPYLALSLTSYELIKVCEPSCFFAFAKSADFCRNFLVVLTVPSFLCLSDGRFNC
jgi:hypothetical protein